MPGIIAKKIGMTSVYDASGKNIPCTVLEVGPCVVTQVKTVESDGYEAIQIGRGERKLKRTPKSLQGHFKKAGIDSAAKVIEVDHFNREVKLGDQVTIEDVCEEGQFVDVIGTSKGKGFQGVVKRHNFRGVGDATHGQHNRMRAPGSIGAASDPARVFKGMRMAGQMGNKRVTTENLKVVKILSEEGYVLIKGAVPGHKGASVIIRK